MFEPHTQLEYLLVKSFNDPTDAHAYTAFARELCGTVLGVLGREEPTGFQPLVLAPFGTRGVCVFTHQARHQTFANDVLLPAPGWQVRPEPARRLFDWAAANSLSVLLNPGSDYGKEFPPLELTAFLRGQWV